METAKTVDITLVNKNTLAQLQQLTPTQERMRACNKMTYVEALVAAGIEFELANGRQTFSAGPVRLLKRQSKLLDRIKLYKQEILQELNEIAYAMEVPAIEMPDTPVTATQVHVVSLAQHQIPPATDDPRADDLPDDSEPWKNLLQAAQSHNSPLLYVLHGFRCMGARLRRTVSCWQIYYDADASGFANEAEFNSEYRKWFNPGDDLLSRADSEINKILAYV